MAIAYVIVNEFTSKMTDSEYTEIIQPARWTQDDAMQDLNDIAIDNGTELDWESTELELPPADHLLSDVYYIMELEITDRG
jgi:hypothetical protein